MLTLSKKAQAMPASPIRKLVPFADAAKKRGIKVYHLNIGQPDIESPKEALDAVKNNQLKVVAYAKSGGNDSLREGLARYYRNCRKRQRCYLSGLRSVRWKRSHHL